MFWGGGMVMRLAIMVEQFRSPFFFFFSNFGLWGDIDS